MGLMDILEIFFGSSSGKGLVEGLARAAGGIFEGAAGAGRSCAAAEGLAGASRGLFTAGELFSFFARGAHMMADRGFDYLIWRDVFDHSGNNRDFKNFWENLSGAEKANMENIRNVAKGHGFILNQLRAHADDERVAELLKDYEALGTGVPSDAQISKVNRTLSRFLHPDTPTAVDDKLFKELGDAVDAMKDPAARKAYNDLRNQKPQAIEELLGKIADTDWRKGFEAEMPAGQKLLTGRVGEASSKSAEWFRGLSTNQKTAVVAAAVAGVGLATHGIASVAYQRSKAKQARQLAAAHEQTDSFVEREQMRQADMVSADVARA